MVTLIIAMLFLSVGSGITVLNAEELIRLSSDESLETRGLYRIRDGDASSECEVFRSGEGEWQAARIILDTPHYQAGSMNPSGLWRFCSMTDLLADDELSQDTGLKPDRSDSSLERPSIAVRMPDRAGLLFKQEEDHRLGALWGRIEPTPYISLEMGESVILPEEEEPDASWFPGAAQGCDDPLYITAADLGWERRSSSLRIRAAASLSKYRLPSCSLLPGLSLYCDRVELLSRFWYNSESWRAGPYEYPEWQWLWDNKLHLIMPGFVRLEAGASGGEGSEGGFGGDIGFSAEFSPGSFELKLDYDMKQSSEEQIRTQGVGGRIRFSHGPWRESFSADISIEEDEPESWSLSPELRRSPRSGRYDKLSCRWKAEPGVLAVTPSFESSVPIGDFRIHCAVSYELLYSEEPVSPDEDDPLSVRLTGEWKGP